MNNCALLSLSYALTGSSDLALLLRYCCAAAIPTILPILLDVDASGLAPNQALADALYEFSCTTAISIMADTVTPSKMMEHPTILCFTELTGITVAVKNGRNPWIVYSPKYYAGAISERVIHLFYSPALKHYVYLDDG